MNWIGVHVDGLLAVYAGLVIVAVGLLTLRQALRRSSKPPKPARKSGALRAGKRSGQGLFHAATVEQTCQGVGGCMAFELRVQMRLAQRDFTELHKSLKRRQADALEIIVRVGIKHHHAILAGLPQMQGQRHGLPKPESGSRLMPGRRRRERVGRRLDPVRRLVQQGLKNGFLDRRDAAMNPQRLRIGPRWAGHDLGLDAGDVLLAKPDPSQANRRTGADEIMAKPLQDGARIVGLLQVRRELHQDLQQGLAFL
ncbi:MAG: hypothetical protein ACYCSR_05240 [Thiomonas sp.]